jgi:hypothetical protein
MISNRRMDALPELQALATRINTLKLARIIRTNPWLERWNQHNLPA